MSQKKKLTPKASPRNTLFNYYSKSTPKTPQTGEIKRDEENLEKKEEKLKTLTGTKLDFGEKFKCEI